MLRGFVPFLSFVAEHRVHREVAAGGIAGSLCGVTDALSPWPARPRPRRRLRRPVRPADRPPGARGARSTARSCRTRWRSADMLAKDPAAIILSGGPSSVYEEGAPALDAALLEAGVPVLRHVLRLPGDGPGARRHRRPHRAARVRRDAGRGLRHRRRPCSTASPPSSRCGCRHGDSVAAGARRHAGHRLHRRRAGRGVRGRRAPAVRRAVAPRGACTRPSASGCSRTSSARRRPRRPTGRRPTSSTTWSRRSASRSATRRVLCALSGGVDSSVAAALVQRAVGDQLTCVFVDHGLLRAGEAEQVEKEFVAATGVDLVVVDAREQFLAALAGVSDPEEKRKIIGARVHPRLRAGGPRRRRVRATPRATRSSSSCRARSTPTSSSPAAAPARPTSSSHHNVGGLPDDLQFKLVEPLRIAVQGRGAPGRARARRARGASSGASRSRARASASASSARSTAERLDDPARGRRDRPRGAHRGRARPRHLAVPGRAARRRPLGRRAGRRPHLRPPGRAAPGRRPRTR